MGDSSVVNNSGTREAPFSCFWGTPFLDAAGQWRCPDNPNTPPVVRPIGGNAPSNPPFGQLPINVYVVSTPPYPSVNAPVTPAVSGTPAASSFPATVNILGHEIKTTWLIGGAAAALFLLSSMDEKGHR